MHQLVLQLSPWGSNELDYDKLVSLEAQLTKALGSRAIVDGHDMGSNEGNAFVLSQNARDTFAKCLPIVKRSGLLALLTAGYRDVGGETYTRIWPHGDISRFRVS